MVRLSKALLKEAGTGLSKTLSEILVCPLSKQSLRFCEETHSLISDSIGVSFPGFSIVSTYNSAIMRCFSVKTVWSKLDPILWGKCVPFAIKDGVPCLVPKDGKILDHVDDQLKDDAGPSAGDDAAMHKD